MKIIIDAMGGDNAPDAIVEGAVSAKKEFGVDIVLVGREAQVRECLAKYGGEGIEVVNAGEVIDMHDDPSTAVRRKKDSSMAVALKMLSEGQGDACISAGSTGALLTGATLTVKRIRGIRRAAMAPVLPNGGAGVVLIDCGANVECTPEYLLQFAYMGSFYSKKILGVESPRVGLLNNGSEDTKGTELQKSAYALMSEAGESGRINFVGNVEGTEVFSGKVDVLVADGYSGNIFLKCIEGTAKYIMKNLKSTLMGSTKGKIAGVLVKKDLSALKKLMDPAEVGGTPFLGISRPVIKAHGNSDARAIHNAVRQAVAYAGAGFIEEIENNIDHMKLRSDED